MTISKPGLRRWLWTIVVMSVVCGHLGTHLGATQSSSNEVSVLLTEARDARRNDPQRALELGENALALAIEQDLQRERISALTTLGVAHYFLGQYNQALERYQAALALAETFGDQTLVADALNNIGIIYFVWGEHDKALEAYLHSLALRLDMNDVVGIGRGYNNVANIYQAAGDFDQALTYYERSLELYESEADTAMITGSLNNIGLLFYDQERFKESLDNYTRALAMETITGDKPGMALTLNNLGQVNEALGLLDVALTQYQEALALRRELGDRQGISVCLHNIGAVKVRQEAYPVAIDYLERALALAEEMGILELVRDDLQGLAEAYEAAGQPDQALAYYKRYKETHDQIFTEERTQQIAMAQTRFEVSLKDREIQVLKKEKEIERFRRQLLLIVIGLAAVIMLLLLNRYLFQRRAHKQIRQKNDALHQAHAELEQAARDELAHVARVATMGELAAAFAHELNQPLAAIKANSRAGRNFLDRPEPDTSEVMAALTDIDEDSERAQNIIIRLRAMMRKGELKRGPVDINRALTDTVAMIGTEAERKNVTLDLRLGQNLPPVTGDRIQLQQVVLNLIQNGLSVTGDQVGATLTIVSELTNDRAVRVLVHDEGPPVSDDVLADMFEPFFTTKEEGLGMGLTICQTIIEAHGGQVQVVRRQPKGLTVSFQLPS